jgi:hypothetical protein
MTAIRRALLALRAERLHLDVKQFQLTMADGHRRTWEAQADVLWRRVWSAEDALDLACREHPVAAALLRSVGELP